MAREGGTLRYHPRTLLSLIVVVASVLGTLVVNDAAFAEGERVDLNKNQTGISLRYEVSVSQKQPNGDYGNYETVEPNADGRYELDPNKYGEYGDARYQFKASFTVEPGVLNGRDTMTFQMPPGLKADPLLETDILNSSGQKVGTYTVDDQGLATLVFDQETVRKNADSPLIGDFTFRAQAGEDANRNGLEWHLPGSDIVVDFGKRYDLHVSKDMQRDTREDVSRPFAVTVTSQYGTMKPVTLKDYLKDAEGVNVEFTDIVVKKNGEASDLTCDGVNCELPTMAAGDSYEISYVMKFDDEQKGKHFANVIEVDSPLKDGGKLSDSAECQFDTPDPGVPDTAPNVEKSRIEEFGDDQSDVTGTRYIRWRIVLNSKGAELNGWTLRDFPGANVGEPQGVCGRVQGAAADAACVITGFPYEFTSADTNTYEIEYVTPYDSMALVDSWSNTAKITKPGEWDREWTATQSGASGNPLAKTGGKLSDVQQVPSPDGITQVTGRELAWTVRINSEHTRALPAGWVYEDTLNQGWGSPSFNHYLTSAQRTTLESAVNDAYTAAGLPAPTITYTTENRDGVQFINGFNLTSADPLPQDKAIEFSYSSTVNVDLTDHKSELDFENKGKIGNFEQTGKVHFEPAGFGTNFRKTDATNGGATTSDDYGNAGHAIDTLPQLNYRPYLEWEIRIEPGTQLFEAIEANPSQTLVITEHLPEDMELMPAQKDGTGLSGLQMDSPQLWYLNGFFSSDAEYDYILNSSPYGPEGTRNQLVASASVSGNDVTITIQPVLLKELVPERTAGGNYEFDQYNRKGITMRVRAYFKSWNPQFTGYHDSVDYRNTVEWSFDDLQGERAENTQTVYDTEGEAGKEFVGVKEHDHNRLPYQLSINPKAERVGEGGKYTFTDVLSYPHADDYGAAKVTLDPTSVRAYAVDPDGTIDFKPKHVTCDNQGTNCGTWEADAIKVRELTPDEFGYVLMSDHPASEPGYTHPNLNGEHVGATWTETLEFTVPDGVQLYIDYTYIMSGSYSKQAWITVANTAQLGDFRAVPSDSHVAINLVAGDASVDGNSFKLYKVDAENNAKRLGGATFQLYVWDAKVSDFVETGRTYATVSEAVKDTQGNVIVPVGAANISVDGDDNNCTGDCVVKYNTAYALKEIEAPDGYQVVDGLRYFMFTRSGSPEGAQPDGFAERRDEYAGVMLVDAKDFMPSMEVADPPEVKIALPAAGGMTSRWIVAAGVTLLLMSMMGTALLLRREATVVA